MRRKAAPRIAAALRPYLLQSFVAHRRLFATPSTRIAASPRQDPLSRKAESPRCGSLFRKAEGPRNDPSSHTAESLCCDSSSRMAAMPHCDPSSRMVVRFRCRSDPSSRKAAILSAILHRARLRVLVARCCTALRPATGRLTSMPRYLSCPAAPPRAPNNAFFGYRSHFLR